MIVLRGRYNIPGKDKQELLKMVNSLFEDDADSVATIDDIIDAMTAYRKAGYGESYRVRIGANLYQLLKEKAIKRVGRKRCGIWHLVWSFRLKLRTYPHP